MRRPVQENIRLPHPRHIVLDLLQDLLQFGGVLECVFVNQLVSGGSSLRAGLAVNLLLHQLPGQEHGDGGRNAHYGDNRNGEYNDNLGLEDKTRLSHQNSATL
jgi:hypothetical protein